MTPEQDRATGTDDETRDEMSEPSAPEEAAWERVRRSATGMRHHEAKTATETARRIAEDAPRPGQDAVIARAEVEEWERITETLTVHAGSYDPESDPYVQGQRAGRARRYRAPIPHR